MIAVAFLVFAAQLLETAETYAALQQRLAAGTFSTVADDKARLLECSVTKSTGDADLDRGFCEITRQCWEEGRGATPTCLDQGIERFMQDLATRRAAIKATS